MTSQSCGNIERPSRDIPVVTIWRKRTAEWLAWLQAGGVSPNTITLRRYQLSRLAADHIKRSPWSLEPTDLAAWLARDNWSPETLRSYRSALRSFYGWAHASGLIDIDPARLLRKVAIPPPVPRPASEVAVTNALHAADGRAWLMLMLGSRHGLRRCEIARVHTDDLRVLDGHTELLVRGKGNKMRVIPVLDEVAALIRAAPAGWLFPNGKGGPLTSAHVGVILRRFLATGVTPHQLRHRFASRAYGATMDIRAVQELLGHASVATTQRYVATSSAALRAAVLSAA